MPTKTDYGLHYDTHQIISGSAYLFRSGALADSSTAISGSTPQIIAITCSANYNNRLTKLTAVNANATITITSGSLNRDNLQNDTKLILRYYSGSELPIDRIPSASDSTIDYLLGGIGTNISYVNIPLLDNDDSFTVAYKTVRALTASVGYNKTFSASLIDDGSNFRLSSSLGDNMAVGSSFKVRNSSSYELPDDYLLSSSGWFKIYSLNSGSVATPDFSGTEVEVGGMQIGTSFMVGGGSGSQAFAFNLIQTGSGLLNQPFFQGYLPLQSSSIGLTLDPDDANSGLITGSGLAKLYFSSSGKMGVSTTNPQTDFDIRADKFRFQTKGATKGIQINEEGNLESFNNETATATTGSEILLTYSAGGTPTITLAAVCAVVAGNTYPSTAGDECGTINEVIVENHEGDVGVFVNATYSDDIIEEILNLTEDVGEFDVPGVNNTIGSLRWVAQSGSQNALNKRTSGSAASISTIIASADNTGVTADMLFKVAQSKKAPPTEVMRISSEGKVSITGSLVVTNNITSSIISSSVLYVQHVTASQNISASGNLFVKGNITGSNISASGGVYGASFFANTAYRIIDGGGTSRHIITNGSDDYTIQIGNAFFTSGVQIVGNMTSSGTIRSSGSIVHGNVSASGNISATGHITSSGRIQTLSHITASGNISSSGLILGRQYEQIMTNTVYDFDNGGFVYLPWGDTDNEAAVGSFTNKYVNRAVVVPGRPVKTIIRSPQNHLGANGEAYTMSLWRHPAESNALTLVSACHATATGTNREAITFDWRNPNSGSATTLVEVGDRILMGLSSSNSQNNGNYTITHLFEWHYDNL